MHIGTLRAYAIIHAFQNKFAYIHAKTSINPRRSENQMNKCKPRRVGVSVCVSVRVINWPGILDLNAFQLVYYKMFLKTNKSLQYMLSTCNELVVY